VSAVFVLDSSVALTWCFRKQRTELSTFALAQLRKGGLAVVPSLWALEVANVLARSVTEEAMTASQADGFVELLLMLPLRFEQTPPERALGDVRGLAVEAGLSAYDATFLELSGRLGIPLATLDERLARAARKAGVALLEPAA
jgi:predicted nucleic acid-binding protein